MFWLTNPKMKFSEILPSDLPEKICVPFSCMGQECKRESEEACTFINPCSAADLKLETIEIIGDHFTAKKFGWFNKYHFMKLTNLKTKYKALMGKKDRPSSKTA